MAPNNKLAIKQALKHLEGEMAITHVVHHCRAHIRRAASGWGGRINKQTFIELAQDVCFSSS